MEAGTSLMSASATSISLISLIIKSNWQNISAFSYNWLYSKLNMPKAQQQVAQVLTTKFILWNWFPISLGGHGQGREAPGNGWEEYAQPLPQEHVGPHWGNKEPESLHEPVRELRSYSGWVWPLCSGTASGAAWRHTPGWRWSSASSGRRRERAGPGSEQRSDFIACFQDPHVATDGGYLDMVPV